MTRLRFGGQTFLLDAAQDLDRLKADIVAAVREGGAFVDVRTTIHGVISLLVTPSTPVVLEAAPRTEPVLEQLDDQPMPLDRWANLYDY